MRTAFVSALLEVAQSDPRVWLVSGDLGYSVLEPFRDRFGDRFLNVGVAEQNMTGVAAGLAMAGKIVFTYSIANFPTLRCLEQVRNDVAYHNLNVKIVAVGGGLAYGSLGYSHHAVEDLAVMRALPNMCVVAPGDPQEARAAVRAIASMSGPAYLRLGKSGEANVHSSEPEITPGRPIRVREGDDVTLVASGGGLALALAASEELAASGVHAGVVSLPFVTEIGEETLASLGDRIVSVEDHGPGGLGGAIAEALCAAGSRARLTPVTLPRGGVSVSGSERALREAQGLTLPRVVEAARRLAA